MPLLDSLLSVIAPHNCLGCDREGSLLCGRCISDVPHPTFHNCYKCRSQSGPGMICNQCRTDSPLTAIRVRTLYGGVPKQLVHMIKFQRAVAAAKPMAQAMVEILPGRLGRVLVVPVPTATSRIRARGYDQAAMLARLIAKNRKLVYCPLLGRSTQTRQVGATRKERREQLRSAFYVRKPNMCDRSPIILIDDVLTTGSSLDAAARTLRDSGAEQVFALAFAYQPLEKSDSSPVLSRPARQV